MLLRLPRNVAALSSLCASTEHSRYGATTGIRIQLRDDGVLRLDATDGRVLGVVQCPPCVGEWDHAEDVVEAHYLDPDDRTVVIVPAKEWKEGLKLKADRSRVYDDSGITVATDGNQVILANQSGKITTPQVEGRFPDVDAVLRSSILENKPRFAVRLDPKLFIKLLQTASAFTADDACGVTLVYYGPGLPVGVVAENRENQQSFDGLIVPLVSADERMPSPAKESSPCALYVKVAHEGGNYLVPVDLVDALGLDEAFRRYTELDPAGIIYPVLLEELYDADWNLVETWEEESDEE